VCPWCVQHADLVKSGEDAHTYLVHDNADPLQASLSGLLLEGLPPMAASALAPRAGAYLGTRTRTGFRRVAHLGFFETHTGTWCTTAPARAGFRSIVGVGFSGCAHVLGAWHC
jgi:hypothetical protein